MCDRSRVSLFDTDAFNTRLFFPRGDVTPPPAGAIDQMVDVDGAALHLRLHAGDAPRVLLLFHGNGEVVADYDEAAPRFAAAGARLAVVDYRGYGRSTGTPTLRNTIADAASVLDAVRTLATAPVVVMGRSLGSACAADLYALGLPSIAGIVIESGYADVAALVRRRGLAPTFTAAEAAPFDSTAKLARGAQPLLVLHGADDAMIAATEAATNAAAAGPSTRLVLVPHRGHNDLSLSPVYWDALSTFLASLP